MCCLEGTFRFAARAMLSVIISVLIALMPTSGASQMNGDYGMSIMFIADGRSMNVSHKSSKSKDVSRS